MLDARVTVRRREVLVDVALQVARGEALALFGPSGAGKSTVLACIAGFVTQDAGHVRVAGRTLFPPPLPLRRRALGYLTQDAHLFPHMTVAENVAFGLGRDRKGAWLCELRDRLGLANVWNAAAARLSGGQERRVALARMLAPRPSLVLLDEPFAALDRGIVRDLLDDLHRWRAALGFTAVVVDHDAALLERFCDRVVALEAGRVVQSATWPELRAHPATPTLARLLAPL